MPFLEQFFYLGNTRNGVFEFRVKNCRNDQVEEKPSFMLADFRVTEFVGESKPVRAPRLM